MSRSDRKRIEDWQDLLRDTELGLPSGGDPRVCAVDEAPKLGITTETLTASSPIPASNGDTDPTGELAKAFTKGGDMMMNLMALSMLCDLNRSMILAYPGYVTFKWDDILHPYDHAGLSNRSGDLTTGTCGVTNVIQLLLQIDNWYAGKFARLVGLLDGLDEGNGTLLDNTATMWLPELSDGGAHNLNNLPILIAGSAGGYLKQGVVVNVEGKPIGLGNSSKSCPSDGTRGTYVNGGSTGGDVPINKLYVTLMNAVGCTQDGTPSSGKVTEFGQFDGFTADGGITSPGEVAALTSAG